MYARRYAVFPILAVLYVGQVQATTLTWTGGAGDRAFGNAANWEDAQGANRAPAPGDRLELREAARLSGAPIFSGTSGTNAYSQIRIGGQAIDINLVETQPELRVEGGLLRVNEMILADGPATRARVIQEGGSVLTNTLRLTATSSVFAPIGSTYRLDDGYLSSALTVIGQSGDATFLQRGGEFEVGGLRVGNSSFQSGGRVNVVGTGTYELRDGVLRSGAIGHPRDSTDPQFFRNAFETVIGSNGRGVFDQSGGLHQVVGGNFGAVQSPLIVGGQALGTAGVILPPYSGTYILRGDGELQSNFGMVVGQGGDMSGVFPRLPGYGLFRQQGDSVASFFGDVVLGQYSTDGGGAGFYRQTGGELGIARDLIIGEAGANGMGAGQMVMTGGEAVVGRNVVINAYARGTNDQVFVDPVFFSQILRNELSMTGLFEGTGQPNPELRAERLIVGGSGDANAPTARLSLNRGATVFGLTEVRAGGELTGRGGILNGTTQIFRGGLLNPGLSPGDLTIDGDLFLFDGSLTRLEIGGLNWGHYDFLTITGDLIAEAGAQIELAFIDGFNPTAPFSLSLFDVWGDASSFNDLILQGLLTVSVTGLASPLDFAFSLSSEGLLVDNVGGPVAAVPLPAAAPLLLAGFALLSFLRRRRTL